MRFITISAFLIALQSCVGHQKALKINPANNAITISSMAELETYVTPESLVLFDLDHTVFEGAHPYGHANWFYGEIEADKLRGIGADDTIRRIYKAWLLSQERASVKPVEALTPELIKRLQDKNIKVMGLTARQTPLIPATLRQLAEIGVDFKKTSLMPAVLSAKQFAAPVAYRDGILFTSEFVKKSQVLKAYLDQVAYQPQHIVFVDDSPKHVDDIIAAFEQTGTKVVGIHYPLVASKRSSWNQSQAAKIYDECTKQTGKLSSQCGNQKSAH